MDSEAISSLVDTEETVIAQIWKKINDIMTEKCKVSKIMKYLWKILQPKAQAK